MWPSSAPTSLDLYLWLFLIKIIWGRRAITINILMIETLLCCRWNTEEDPSESSTQFYPNFPILRLPKKYNIRYCKEFIHSNWVNDTGTSRIMTFAEKNTPKQTILPMEFFPLVSNEIYMRYTFTKYLHKVAPVQRT